MTACRKRRIKCGEEKPRCRNCIKSKRECEGYTPRVIFTDPLGAYGPGGSHLQQMSLQLPLFTQQQRRLPNVQSVGSQQRLLAPRPPTLPLPTIAESSAFALSAGLPNGPGDNPPPFYYPPIAVAQSAGPFHSSPPVHGVFPAQGAQPLEGTSDRARSLDQQRGRFQVRAAPAVGA